MEERCPDKTIIIKCVHKKQEITDILHIFKASQWRSNLRAGSRNCCPRLPSRDSIPWDNHFRVRFNGKWWGDTVHKYCFYSKADILAIVGELM